MLMGVSYFTDPARLRGLLAISVLHLLPLHLVVLPFEPELFFGGMFGTLFVEEVLHHY